jgi:hypothetical protein
MLLKLVPENASTWPNEQIPDTPLQFALKMDEKNEILIGRTELTERFKVEGLISSYNHTIVFESNSKIVMSFY